MYRGPSKKYDDNGKHIGMGPWIDVIRTCNQISHERQEVEPFGQPTELGPWWAGGFHEEYPDFRVLMNVDGSEDETVRIIPKNKDAELLLDAALDRLRL